MQQGYRNLAWGPLGGEPLGQSNRLYVSTGARQTAIKTILTNVGASMGVTSTPVVALAWLLAHPSHPIPLLGTTKVARIVEYAAAMDIVPLFTPAYWHAIARVVGLCPVGDLTCDYATFIPAS
jgi:predicted oxidoreductase